MTSTIVTPVFLAAARANILAILTDLVTIQRYTTASDGMGGLTGTWSTLATLVPARIEPAGNSGEERRVADRIDSVVVWTVVFVSGQDVTAADRIISGSRTFEVVAILAPQTDEVARRAICIEVL